MGYNDFESPVIRWTVPLYANLAPLGVSYYSYDFKFVPRERDGLVYGGCIYSSAGLDIHVTLYIEVTNGYVSGITRDIWFPCLRWIR